jgi:hypothetical protein
MILPDNWILFKKIVLEKLKLYCDSRIWPFQFDALAAWLGNFDDEIEEYLALQLLDSLIVRSNEMAKASYARLMHSDLRSYLIDNQITNRTTITNWKNQLKNGGLNSIVRFSPVRTSIDEGESGSLVYRLLSSEIDTNRYSLAKIKSQPSTIVLIDDFIGSGNQFINEFAPEFLLNEKLDNGKVVYCPLLAYEEGISEIKNIFPKLDVIPAEVICKESSLFYGDDNSFFKNDQVNTIGDVKLLFSKMKNKYAPKNSNWFGYNDACLPIVFEWGCPNQTPAIYWMNQSKYKKDWKKLFGRRA